MKRKFFPFFLRGTALIILLFSVFVLAYLWQVGIPKTIDANDQAQASAKSTQTQIQSLEAPAPITKTEQKTTPMKASDAGFIGSAIAEATKGARTNVKSLSCTQTPENLLVSSSCDVSIVANYAQTKEWLSTILRRIPNLALLSIQIEPTSDLPKREVRSQIKFGLLVD
jgi:hypothetical protein